MSGAFSASPLSTALTSSPCAKAGARTDPSNRRSAANGAASSNRRRPSGNKAAPRSNPRGALPFFHRAFFPRERSARFGLAPRPSPCPRKQPSTWPALDLRCRPFPSRRGTRFFPAFIRTSLVESGGSGRAHCRAALPTRVRGFREPRPANCRSRSRPPVQAGTLYLLSRRTLSAVPVSDDSTSEGSPLLLDLHSTLVHELRP